MDFEVASLMATRPVSEASSWGWTSHSNREAREVSMSFLVGNDMLLIDDIA
ncbi:hypothetical protein C5167_017596 [Papaver somniferum]|uniref:Uncharacterized protein n=1 Tax=Papaver somniferum TaxID=3469 RepID=A0A4Y7IMZ3_PAPSO|nr:hypothetical protein C5167_017596 [Papaver somniferum]